MPAMTSTERIYLRMERPGFPCDIAGINVLEASPQGPLPFEQVRAVFDQRAHRVTPADPQCSRPPPSGIGEDRWTQAATLDIDAHVHHWQVPAPGDIRCPACHGHRAVRRTRSTGADRCGRRGT